MNRSVFQCVVSLASVLLVSPMVVLAELPMEGKLFSDPVNISANNGNSVLQQIAVTSTGTIYIMSVDNIDNFPSYTLFFTRSIDGGVTFSPPKNVSQHSAGFPQFAMDGSQNIYTVWQQGPVGSVDIFFSSSSDGGVNFSDPTNVSNSGYGYVPQVAVGPSGTIYVTWRDSSVSGDHDIFLIKSDDGGLSFSDPPMTIDLGNSLNQKIAVDNDNVYMAWREIYPGGIRLVFSRSTDGGTTFDLPMTISPTTGSGPDRGRLILDSSGSIYLIWSGPSVFGNNDVFFSSSTDGGYSFSIPNNVSKNGGAAREEVAVGPSGTIYVTWVAGYSGNTDIFFSSSIDGGASFSAASNVSANALNSFHPELAVDDSGTIHLAWADSTPGNDEILLSSSSDVGVNFSVPTNLSDNAGSSTYPLLAVDGKSLFVAWNDRTPGNWEIFFSRSLTELLEQLVNDVVALNLKQGIENSLDGKLDAALGALDDANENNDVAAIQALEAFINNVEAQRGVHIPDADADELIKAAREIIAFLGG